MPQLFRGLIKGFSKDEWNDSWMSILVEEMKNSTCEW
jgi:hypothetical protein